MRLTPRQLQTTAPTPWSQWMGAWAPTTPQTLSNSDHTTPQTPSNSAVSLNVDACTILPQPLTPSTLSGIPEGSIDSIGDPLGLDRSGIP